MYPKGHQQLSPDPTLLPHVLLRCGGIPAFYHTKKSPKTHAVFCSCSHAAVSFVKNSSKSIPLVHTQFESCGTGKAGCHWIFLFIGIVLISKMERSLLFQNYLRSFRASVQRLRVCNRIPQRGTVGAQIESSLLSKSQGRFTPRTHSTLWLRFLTRWAPYI